MIEERNTHLYVCVCELWVSITKKKKVTDRHMHVWNDRMILLEFQKLLKLCKTELKQDDMILNELKSRDTENVLKNSRLKWITTFLFYIFHI